MRTSVLAWIAVVVAACSSDTEGSSPASPCADISGNYTVQVERVSGSCDPAIDPASATIGFSKQDDGTWLALIPGVPGGCPGTLDAGSCKFSSACEFKDAGGAVVGTSNISYVFTAGGYTGTTANGVRPPTVPAVCDVTYRETGTKL